MQSAWDDVNEEIHRAANRRMEDADLERYVTHRLDNLDPPLAQATLAARVLLLPCDPQPPPGFRLHLSYLNNEGYPQANFEDGPYVQLVTCPYNVSDVVRFQGPCPYEGRYQYDWGKRRIVKIGEPVDVREAVKLECDHIRYSCEEISCWAPVEKAYLAANPDKPWARPLKLEALPSK